MRGPYEALIRRCGAVGYWPLNPARFGFAVIGGVDFSLSTAPSVGDDDAIQMKNGVVYDTASSPMTATNNHTMMIWVKPLIIPATGATIVSNGAVASNGTELEWQANLSYRVFLGGVGNLGTSSKRARLGQWNLIVAVRNAGTWSLYLNGELDDTIGSAANTAPTLVRLHNSAADHSLLRHLSLHDRVVTAAEIRDCWLMGRDPVTMVEISGGTAQTIGTIEPPFISSTTVLFEQEIDRPVNIVPLTLIWSRR